MINHLSISWSGGGGRLYALPLTTAEVNKVYAVSLYKDDKVAGRWVVDKNNAKEVEGEADITLDHLFRLDVATLARDYLPGVQEKVVHPVTKKERTLWSIIMNLNDTHKWTREEIADWIRSLPNQERFQL